MDEFWISNWVYWTRLQLVTTLCRSPHGLLFSVTLLGSGFQRLLPAHVLARLQASPGNLILWQLASDGLHRKHFQQFLHCCLHMLLWYCCVFTKPLPSNVSMSGITIGMCNSYIIIVFQLLCILCTIHTNLYTNIELPKIWVPYLPINRMDSSLVLCNFVKTVLGFYLQPG
jgi:hypothetical protein